MKALLISVTVVLAISMGCSSSNSITVCKTEVEVIAVSYQERVSGVKGYGSTYHFDFEFKVPAKGEMPDSVFFKNNAGKILQNFELDTYYAKVHVKPEDNRSTDTSVWISFKTEDEITRKAVDSVTVLEKVHMP